VRIRVSPSALTCCTSLLSNALQVKPSNGGKGGGGSRSGGAGEGAEGALSSAADAPDILDDISDRESLDYAKRFPASFD
jgi:hypothetical protein